MAQQYTGSFLSDLQDMAWIPPCSLGDSIPAVDSSEDQIGNNKQLFYLFSFVIKKLYWSRNENIE